MSRSATEPLSHPRSKNAAPSASRAGPRSPSSPDHRGRRVYGNPPKATGTTPQQEVTAPPRPSRRRASRFAITLFWDAEVCVCVERRRAGVLSRPFLRPAAGADQRRLRRVRTSPVSGPERLLTTHGWFRGRSAATSSARRASVPPHSLRLGRGIAPGVPPLHRFNKASPSSTFALMG